MVRIWAGLALLVFSVALLVAVAEPVLATVTIQGRVEYWDRIANAKKPARHVLVEVEGDWWDFWNDPQVTTDDNGRYVAHFRDPFWSWDSFNISIDAYARTPDRFEVYENMFEAWLNMYPYSATSPNHGGVKGGQTCTIDLYIGPGGNVVDTWCRSVDETANAFLVVQEMLDHYQKLVQMGFVPADFEKIKVLAPAALATPYYNHITEFINLCIDSAGVTGTGNWTVLPAGDVWYMGYPRFKETVRHEYSHAIHDHITGAFAPLGLDMPAEHSVKSDTNRWLAYTEGFAEFLPLAALNLGGSFANPSGPSSLGLAAADPPGGHYSWEGEVAGLFWDLTDPANQTEPLRHPATKTTDGRPVPSSLVDAQVWTDRIADPNLAKLRAAVVTWTSVVPPWPVDTIEEFLGIYKFFNPADLHALKTIAFNRDILNSLPPEQPAYINGNPDIQRSGGTVTLKLTVTEPNQEDRPFVQVTVWHQTGGGPVKLLATSNLTGSWPGADRALVLQVPTPKPVGADDLLWVLVSDEMLPSAYCFENPAEHIEIAKKLPPEWFKSPVSAWAGFGQVVGAAVTEAKPFHEGKPISEQMITAGAIDGVTVADQTKGMDNLRSLVQQAGILLAAYGDRCEMVRRTDRGLVSAARRLDDLAVPEDARDRIALPPHAGRRVRAAQPAEDAQVTAAYGQWLDGVAGGALPKRPLPAEARQSLQTHEKLVEATLALHPQQAAHARDLATQLRAAFVATEFTPEQADLKADTDKAIQALEAGLNQEADDADLLPRLQKHDAALRTLAGLSPGAATAKLPTVGPKVPAVPKPPKPPQPVVVTPTPAPAAAALAESFGAAAPPGWVLLPGATIGGGVLTCSDMGHGAWLAAFPEDFTLKLRYRQAQGIGQVILRLTGQLPQDNDYRLRLDGLTAVIARAELGQEKVLQAKPLALLPDSWHDLAITFSAGRIRLAVDGKPLLDATDPAPLPNGALAFGSVNAKNVAFDDISVTAGAGVAATPAPLLPAPATAALAEEFDSATPQGWVLTPGAKIDAGALSCSQMGHGVWLAPFPDQFTLKLRYKQGQGLGQVLLRLTGDLPADNDYRLRLDGLTATLARAQLGQEKVLEMKLLALLPNSWHDLVISFSAGRIKLAVDGKPVLDTTDPTPLANGALAFGSVNATGVAFDDVSVTSP